MPIDQMEEARHSEERGAILQALKRNYGRDMTSIKSLWRTLNAIGIATSISGLGFHLTYLSDQEYARIWRVRDMPGYRSDRYANGDPEAIVFARLLPRGLLLIDGQIPADPKVIF